MPVSRSPEERELAFTKDLESLLANALNAVLEYNWSHSPRDAAHLDPQLVKLQQILNDYFSRRPHGEPAPAGRGVPHS